MFDQIGLFLRDRRFPACDVNEDMGKRPEGPDYGVFDFVDLFARAVLNKPFVRLSKREKAALVKRFEHKVSDHLPLWIRLPMPRYAREERRRPVSSASGALGLRRPATALSPAPPPPPGEAAVATGIP